MYQFFFNLRFRLILLILLAVVPALGLTLYTGLEQRQRAANQAKDEALSLARFISSRQRQLIEGTHHFLNVLAQLPQVRSCDPTACSRLFGDLLKQYPHYLNIGVIGLDGYVFASAIPFTKPIYAADRSYFQRALKTRKFTIGEYQIGRITGKPGVNLGYPVMDDMGKVRAVVFVALDLSWLNQMSGEADLPKDSTTSLIDSDSTILARYPESEKWVGKTMLEAPIIKTILGKGEGIIETIGEDKVRRLYAFTSFGSTENQADKIYVSIGIPSSAVFAQVNRILVRNLAFLLFISLLALSAAWFGGNLLVLRRLNPIVSAAKRLCAGDLSVRTGIAYGKGELSQLAFTFDEMAESLEKHEAERKIAEEKIIHLNRVYAVLSEINQAIVRIRNRQELFQEICRIAIEFGKFIMAWIGLVDSSTKLVKTVAHSGVEEGYLENIRISASEETEGYGPTGMTTREGRYFICNDIQNDPCILPWREEALKRGYFSSAAFPIKIQSQVIGTINFYSSEANFFEKEETDLLEEISNDLSFALESMESEENRKQAEEALRHSEEQYRLITENTKDLICTLDLQGNFNYVSPSFKEVLEYSPEELTGCNVFSLIHPDDRETVMEIYQQALINREGRTLELRYQHKNGNWHIFESVGNWIFDGNGTPQKAVIVSRDITKRKQAEEALRRAEEKYRDIVENAVEGIFQTTPEGRFISANPTLARIHGFDSPEELISSTTAMGYESFVDPDRRAEFAGLLRTQGTIQNFEAQLYRKDRRAIWVSMNTRAHRNSKGKLLYYEGTVQDITEHKRAEESLRQSEENARQLAQENAVMAEIGRIISSTLNIDEIYESFVEGVKKIISFDRIVINTIDTEKSTVRNAYIAGEKIQDRNVKDVYPLEGSGNAEMVCTKSTLLIQTEDFSEYKDRFPMLLSTFQAGFRSIMNVPLFSKGQVIGGLLLRSCKPYAYMDKDVRLAERIGSQIAGAIANAQLYTERIQAEKGRAALEEQLRQSQKMEAIGRLAGGVAHDFNNILTVIKGYSQLSLAEMKEGDPFWGNIEKIKMSADRAADLTRQLLAFSRRQIMEMKVIDLNTVLNNLDKMLRRVIGEDIELVTVLGEDLGKVKTDPSQIEQVIMNLAVNARDAMLNGGKLTLETANVELDEEYARGHITVKPGPYVMLSVSDTGVGMTPEVRERVFEPFFTTKEKGKGTGLGLSTVYGTVKQSGGNIWVYSEIGKGTTFKIYLPRVEEPLEEIKEKVVKDELPRGNETVLIVEDEEDVLRLAGRILSRQGYKVLEATNGDEALEVCRKEKQPIYMILTDVVMPQMSGRELIEKCRELRQDFKSVYMSGYTDNSITHHGVLERGMNYIQKPFTVDGLARKVREVLDKL
jgi:PAS domain S-box-containing protein